MSFGQLVGLCNRGLGHVKKHLGGVSSQIMTDLVSLSRRKYQGSGEGTERARPSRVRLDNSLVQSAVVLDVLKPMLGDRLVIARWCARSLVHLPLLSRGLCGEILRQNLPGY
jgi:hypothetical protein